MYLAKITQPEESEMESLDVVIFTKILSLLFLKRPVSTLNDTYNITDRFFAIFSKLFKILIWNFQESDKNISDKFK